jgi:magnesium transporter
MLGVVSFDDMAEAIDDESENDYAQLAAVSDIDIAEEDENVLLTVKKRFPWLAILLFFDLITSSIVAKFEGVLTVLPTLALFMPLILNMAGNTGTQSLGVIIGLFAVNELDDRKKIGRHLLNELLVGLLNGFFIGLILFGMVLLFQRFGGSTWAESARFAMVISLAIGVALGASTMAGALVPLFIKWLRLDPAVASGPFITTIDDILSLLIYFALAVTMLGDLL